jgi:lysophospholipase L1-like esterase
MNVAMNHSRFLRCWLLAALLACGTTARAQQTGVWKTAYVKRGFVGNYDASWAGGTGATLRMRVPMPFDGTKARVYVRGCFDAETELARMCLVRGVDDGGKITGTQYPVLFRGTPSLKLEKGLKEAVSDEVDVPVAQGVWYVQDRYAGPKYPYAYEVDKEFYAPGEHFEEESLAKSVGARLGIVTRIDVFTADPRPVIVCYGDSITHGYSSTPNAGHRYPDVLGRLLNRPTLNLGVNGDMVSQAGALPSTAAQLKGVDTVVFLMGINDIISGRDFSKDKFVQNVRAVIDGCHGKKLKFFIGTILPAGGQKSFDADPAKEALRQEINEWIRHDTTADGIVDFDAALADPQNPVRMRADCQSDWVHPNDHGYEKMAEAAAQVIGIRAIEK